MRHQTIAIEFDDLMARVGRDSDTPWRSVIGINSEVLDELESQLREATTAGEAETETRLMREIEQAERQLVGGLTCTWFQVSWPEHVINPRYNSDANYSHCETREEALADAVEYAG